MQLQLFDGGLCTRKAPQFLSASQGVVYENVDNAKGTLSPVMQALQSDYTHGKYAYYFSAQDYWVNPSVQTSFAVLEDKLYYSNTYGAYKLDDGVELPLGIPPPDFAPTATVNYTIPKVTGCTATNAAGGNLPGNSLHYVLVNVDADGNLSNGLLVRVARSYTETTSVTTSEYDPAFWEVITDVSSSDSMDRKVVFKKFAVTAISAKLELYRLYEDGFHLVGSTTSTSTDITDSVYDISANKMLDNDMFGKLDGTYNYVYTYYDKDRGIESAPSPLSGEVEVAGGTISISDMVQSACSTVTNIILYRVGGDSSNFTKVVELAVDELSYTDAISDTDLSATLLTSTTYDAPPEGLQYIIEAYAMLFGAVETKLYYTPIGVPDAWPGDNYIEIGETITGIGAVASGLLVFTSAKTYLISGTGPNSLSKLLLTEDQGCKVHWSIASSQGALLWVSNDGICSSSGGIPTVVTKDLLGKVDLDAIQAIVFDEVYYCLLSDYSLIALDFRFSTPIVKKLKLGVQSLVKANDKLYGYSSGYLQQLFAGSDPLTFSYKSPRLSEGSVVVSKTYKKIFIYSKGVIELNIYINDKLVATASYSDEDSHALLIPQEQQRGFFIQFEVSGTGEVYEIAYSAGEKNG